MIATRRGVFALVAGGLVAVAAPASAQAVIQERAMPEAKVEVIPASPHPNWSWVKGYWDWGEREGEWFWIPGRWVKTAAPPMPEPLAETPPPPPSPSHSWVRGHWIWECHRWEWKKGQWVG